MGIDTAQPGARRKSKTVRMFAPDGKSGARLTASLSDALAQLSDEIATKALRSAVYAGARVLYDELNVRVASMSKSGQLKDALYHWHDDKKSGEMKQTYAVGVNKSQAPHWFNLEYGHWRVNTIVEIDGKLVATKQRLTTPKWVEAQPYLRPTWEAKAGAAVAAMQERLAVRIKELSAGGA